MIEPTVLCTLFNHYYLDKGLVLYDSLKRVSKSFRLYILCMDDRCYEILSDMKCMEIVPVKLSDFEDDDLRGARSNRSFGEYCWTCSSSFIYYILEHYKEPICTYIDADTYFYQDPEILIDEMRKSGKSVLITPHRFSPENQYLEINGKYCVEFNTFVNNTDGLSVLKKWKQDCLDCCTSVNDGVHFGDQKYMDTWPTDYPDIVHVCQNPGAGTAPWNIELYKLANNERHEVCYKTNNAIVPIVFHHFQHVTYINRHEIKVGIPCNRNTVDYNLIDSLYINYLGKIEQKKVFLEDSYNVNYIMKEHPGIKIGKQWKTWLKQFKIVRLVLSNLFPDKVEYTVHI